MASHDMAINYLTPTEKSPVFPPLLINLFRQHFHGRIPVGGSQEDFLAEYKTFRTVYENHTLQEALNHREQHKVPAPDPEWYQRVKDHVGHVLDEFLILVIGMGQITNCFNLVPTPEIPPEIQYPPPPTRVKRPPSRRYVHVLGNMIQKSKDAKNPGPHGIPVDVRDKVPKAEEMILEMVEAMRNDVEVLDYYDTKPYKDHWRAMDDNDFYGLATTLHKHMNELHQGIDHVEGFQYVNRYQNLISLLRKCKGTIYFMSRPSTYEDVLLNPHMMELRFADNQKNNAKKKVDNRELAARRAQEYFALHGCLPPPKERVLKGAAKGKAAKRTVDDNDDDDDDESPSPPQKATPKRRKASPRKSRGKAVASAAAAPVKSGRGSLALDSDYKPSSSSAPFLGVPPLEGGKNVPEHQSWASQQQQHQFSLQQFGIEPYKPPQQKSILHEQLLRLRDKRITRGDIDETVGTGISIVPDLDFDIDNQIATTLYSSLHEESVPKSFLDGLDSSPFEHSPINYKQQQAPVTGYSSNMLDIDPQIADYQGAEAPMSQRGFDQQEPIYHTQEWYNGQQYLQRTNLGMQKYGTRQVHRQEPYQQVQRQEQTYQPQILNSSVKDFPHSSLPGWSKNVQATESNDANDNKKFNQGRKTPDIEFISNNFMLGIGGNLGEKEMAYNSPGLFGLQFDSDPDSLQKDLPFSTDSGVNSFGDNSDVTTRNEDYNDGMDWDDGFLFGGPVDENGDQFFDPYTLPKPSHSGENMMKEMEMLLKGDP